MTTPTLAELKEAWPISHPTGACIGSEPTRTFRMCPYCALRAALDHADALQRDNEWRGNKLDQWAQENAALEAENAELKRSRTIADEHLRADTERLRRIGALLPLMLDTLPWGAYKGALMEDGDIRAAIEMAKGKP